MRQLPFTPLHASVASRVGYATLTAVLLTTAVAGTRRLARPAESGSAQDPRWVAIRRVFGQEGEAEDGYFRINLPRTDLHVRIGADALSPRFEFTSYLGFIPTGGSRQVTAVGEVILRDDEVRAALDEAHRQGVRATALHNHLIGESPRIMYLHVMADGTADSIASKLRAVFAKTATPLGAVASAPVTGDWTSIDAILGKHSEAEESIAEYEFPRNERLTVHGHAVKSTGVLETGSEAVFQQLGGGRVASTGELFVLPSEVEPVVRALDEHGLHVTAVHNHMLDETPTMYWVHWYATGDGPTLARGVEAALSHMNGARKTASK